MTYSRVRDVTELFSAAHILIVAPFLFLSSTSTSLMHRSPRMIPSRTVFNHCKWIYIELAITSAHSGMGPLCISPAPTPAARARANVFPISSLCTSGCSNPSTPGIVACSQFYTSLFSLSSSFLECSCLSSIPHGVSHSQHQASFDVDLSFFLATL